jgi:hypothetical protein
MIYDRLGTEPSVTSSLSDAILELGIFVATTVLSRHSLLAQQTGSFIPQSEPIEQVLWDAHVATPDVLESQQLPVVAVVQKPGIGERGLIQPIGPCAKIMRDRNDRSTSQQQRVLVSRKEPVIRVDPVRIHAHVIIGE